MNEKSEEEKNTLFNFFKMKNSEIVQEEDIIKNKKFISKNKLKEKSENIKRQNNEKGILKNIKKLKI